MKRCIVVLLFLLCAVESLSARSVPALSGRITDTAAMLSDRAVTELETKLTAIEKMDSTQIVILTVESLEGEPIERFGIRVAEAWKIGQAGKDNGIIIIVSKKDHRMRIEVGRGLEESMTDLAAGRIIDTIMAPRFKKGEFDEGFIEGTDAVIDICLGLYKNDEPQKTVFIRGDVAIFIAGIATIAIIILTPWTRLGGGVIGTIVFPFVFHISVMRLTVLLYILAMCLGFLAGIGLTFLPRRGGSNGDYDGGSGSGSSSSGDSFSGGGGSFGGGGASGDW